MRSRKGDKWAIVSLQDMTAAAEVLAFPEAFARLEGTLKSAGPLILKARVNVEEVGTRLVVMEARVLEGAPGGVRALRVRVDLAGDVMDEFTLDRLRELFASKPGQCPVVFDLLSADGSAATLRAQQRVRLDDDLLVAVRAMCGADAVDLDRSPA
jgi:DNA polymerase-3 subunit alpha